ncbi:Ig-like domain-containing protein [Gorillibacterium sp. sgz500922]|uniref:Ig-like domain-containing protein n=1 Tax=Gorillibacterium sp. sgz500922 TaxID=3446694 RepID=UPI003F67AF32
MKATRIIALLLTAALCLSPFTSIAAAASADLSKLVVSKNEVTLEVGDSLSLSSTAVYTDGSTAVVTVSTTWTSENSSVASVYNGTITAKAEGTAILTAVYHNQSQAVQVTVTKKVKSLTKSKQKLEIRLQDKATVELTATYSDNSTEEVRSKADWSSSDDDVATVVNGVVTGVGSGSATITAKLGSQTTSIPVYVELVKRLDLSESSLSLLLKEKNTLELIATYPDGTTRNVAADADWTTSDSTVADVIRGTVTGYKAGTATLTAAYGGKSTTIAVNVDATSKLDVSEQKLFLHKNSQKQLKLTAVYPNGTSTDVTSLATWGSSNEAVATVANGSVAAVAPGSVTITATYGTKKVTVNVDVNIPRYLELSDDSVSMKAKETAAISLMATYLDGTREDVANLATWSSTKEEIAYFDQGKIYSVGQGEAKLTASYGGKTATVTVDVEVPAKLALNSKTAALGIGESYQPKLLAIFADGHEEDITAKATWSSSAASIAEVNASGLVLGVASGSATVTAKYQSLSVTLSVGVALASKLTPDVRSVFLNANQSKTIKLTATDSAGKNTDVTADAQWKVGNAKIADVNDGVVTGYTRGSTTVTAQYGGKTVSIPVDVDVVQKLEVNKKSLSLKSGDKYQLALTVTFSDGSKKAVTAEAEWTSSAYKVADVNDGLISAIAYGKSTITAKYGNKSVTVALDVDTLKYLQTDEVVLNVAVGSKTKVVATATYANGTEEDVSKPALWSSSKVSVADVKDGVIRAIGKGKATITVSYAGKKAKITVNVK